VKKAEYIRILKRLIKKYHPDLCKDIYLEKIYNEITIRLNNKLNQLKIGNKNVNILDNDSLILKKKQKRRKKKSAINQ
jgi:hypothetical protein